VLLAITGSPGAGDQKEAQMTRVVAWHFTRDAVRCDHCGRPATVDVVEEDGVTVISLCNDCLEPDTPDPILDTFVRAAEAQREREQQRRGN
jgi:NAD-dependent SIR2 family protein deacetylase